MEKGCRRLLSLCIVKRGLWYYHLSHDEDLKTVVLTLHVPFKLLDSTEVYLTNLYKTFMDRSSEA